MPDRVELLPDDCVEGAEERILGRELGDIDRGIRLAELLYARLGNGGGRLGEGGAEVGGGREGDVAELTTEKRRRPRNWIPGAPSRTSVGV